MGSRGVGLLKKCINADEIYLHDKIEKRRSDNERLFFCSNLKFVISFLSGIIVNSDN